MPQIFRTEAPVGAEFLAPRNVTFGWQEQRSMFSVWYNSDDKAEDTYTILGTGHTAPWPCDLVDSVVMPDGFHVFHLVRKIS